MVIVSGFLQVDPAQRAAYLDTCRFVVESARVAEGCLDYALSADLLDPGRINILERWENRAAVGAFRGDGTDDGQAPMILGAQVSEFDISAERRLS